MASKNSSLCAIMLVYNVQIEVGNRCCVIFQLYEFCYLQLNGVWNPLLTQCLLDEYKKDIFGPHVGCQFLDLLSFFGHQGKHAGWQGKLNSPRFPNFCLRKTGCYIFLKNYHVNLDIMCLFKQLNASYNSM